MGPFSWQSGSQGPEEILLPDGPVHYHENPCHKYGFSWSYFYGPNLPEVPATHATTTVPVMCGCIEQKYSYVPRSWKTNENFSSVSSALEPNFLSVLVTVCGTSSRFVQVTLVPAETVNAEGLNVKLSMLTSFFPPPPLFSFLSSCFSGPPATEISGWSMIASEWFPST